MAGLGLRALAEKIGDFRAGPGVTWRHPHPGAQVVLAGVPASNVAAHGLSSLSLEVSGSTFLPRT